MANYRKNKIVKSLRKWDKEFTFVTEPRFNSQYYDNAKMSVQSGQVYQVMKQFLRLKSLPMDSNKKNKKSKK